MFCGKLTFGLGVFGHSLTLLPDGRVFLLGGGSSKMPGENQVNSMFYLPDADRWVKGPTVPAPYCTSLNLSPKPSSSLILELLVTLVSADLVLDDLSLVNLQNTHPLPLEFLVCWHQD